MLVWLLGLLAVASGATVCKDQDPLVTFGKDKKEVVTCFDVDNKGNMLIGGYSESTDLVTTFEQGFLIYMYSNFTVKWAKEFFDQDNDNTAIFQISQCSFHYTGDFVQFSSKQSPIYFIQMDIDANITFAVSLSQTLDGCDTQPHMSSTDRAFLQCHDKNFRWRLIRLDYTEGTSAPPKFTALEEITVGDVGKVSQPTSTCYASKEGAIFTGGYIHYKAAIAKIQNPTHANFQLGWVGELANITYQSTVSQVGCLANHVVATIEFKKSILDSGYDEPLILKFSQTNLAADPVVKMFVSGSGVERCLGIDVHRDQFGQLVDIVYMVFGSNSGDWKGADLALDTRQDVVILSMVGDDIDPITCTQCIYKHVRYSADMHVAESGWRVRRDPFNNLNQRFYMAGFTSKILDTSYDAPTPYIQQFSSLDDVVAPQATCFTMQPIQDPKTFLMSTLVYTDVYWANLIFKDKTAAYHITTNVTPLQLGVNHNIQTSSILRNGLTAQLFVDSPCFGKLIYSIDPNQTEFQYYVGHNRSDIAYPLVLNSLQCSDATMLYSVRMADGSPWPSFITWTQDAKYNQLSVYSTNNSDAGVYIIEVVSKNSLSLREQIDTVTLNVGINTVPYFNESIPETIYLSVGVQNSYLFPAIIDDENNTIDVQVQWSTLNSEVGNFMTYQDKGLFFFPTDDQKGEYFINIILNELDGDQSTSFSVKISINSTKLTCEITDVTHEGLFTITFSETLNDLSSHLFKDSEISVGVDGPLQEYVLEWKVINMTRTQMFLQVTFADPHVIGLLEDQQENVTVRFVDNSLFMSTQYNVSLSTKGVSTILDSVLHLDYGAVPTMTSLNKALSPILMTVLAVSIVALLGWGIQMEVMWMLLFSVQMIAIIPLLGLRLPSFLYLGMQYFEFSNINFGVFNNPSYSYFSIDRLVMEKSLAIPRLRYFDKSSFYLFMNCADQIFFFCLYVICYCTYLLAGVLSGLCCGLKSARFTKKLMKPIAYNFIIRLTLQTYLPIWVYMFFNFRFQWGSDNSASVVSILFCFAFMVFYVYFAVHSSILLRLEEATLEVQKGSLGSFYNQQISDTKHYFLNYQIFYLRRFVSALIISFGTNAPAAQTVLLLLLSLGNIAFHVLMRPYKAKLTQFVMIGFEGCVALSMLIATVMATSSSQDAIVGCSWVVFTICAIMTSFGLFLGLLLLMYEVFSRTKDLLRKQGTANTSKAKLEPATAGKYHQKVNDTSISVDQTQVTETATTRQDTKKGDFQKVGGTKIESDAMQKFRRRAMEARQQQKASKGDKPKTTGDEWNLPKKEEAKQTPGEEAKKEEKTKRQKTLKKRRQSVKAPSKIETQPTQPNQKYTEQQKKATMQGEWLSKQKEMLGTKNGKKAVVDSDVWGQ